MNKKVIILTVLTVLTLFVLTACGSASPDGSWTDPSYSDYQLVLQDGNAQVVMPSDGTVISSGTYTPRAVHICGTAAHIIRPITAAMPAKTRPYLAQSLISSP